MGLRWADLDPAITILGYFNPPLGYAKSVANQVETGMLFNKRRFSKLCDRFFRGRDSIVDKESRRSSSTPLEAFTPGR
jgi:hypothetical protein